MCVWKSWGAIFLALMGGGHAIASSRNGGVVNIFFLLRAAVCHLPPSAEIYEQSLILAQAFHTNAVQIATLTSSTVSRGLVILLKYLKKKVEAKQTESVQRKQL